MKTPQLDRAMRVFSLIGSLLIPVAVGLALPGQAQSPPPVPPQIPRDQWKDCLYNKEVIRCRDEQTADVLRIVWVDGVRTRLERRPSARPGLPSYWGDPYGGLWRREVLIQGNTLLTNLGTGNRILIPIRYPCKSPLKGEVGYCRY
ncbi:MAG: hypothetical protein ACKOOC_10055 [Cyanobium sp.]